MSPSIIIAAFELTEPTSTPAVMMSLFFQVLSVKTLWYSCQRQYSTSSFPGVSSFITFDLPYAAGCDESGSQRASKLGMLGYQYVNPELPFKRCDETHVFGSAADENNIRSQSQPEQHRRDSVSHSVKNRTGNLRLRLLTVNQSHHVRLSENHARSVYRA